MDVTICIPVGPGHGEIYREAIDSCARAAERPGRFRHIDAAILNDQDARRGRSAARNELARRAETEWLFFLDADDVMSYPGILGEGNPQISAFEAVAPHLETEDAIFGAIWELGRGSARYRPQRSQIASYIELLATDPFEAVQMGHFVRRNAFDGFNEDMDTGEDVDYYLRMWRKRRCIKIAEPLMVNRRGLHSEGPRAATGREWTETAARLIADARAQA